MWRAPVRTLRRTFALLCCLTAGSCPVFAQALLYDPLPPKGSAYLRLANATSQALSIDAAFLPDRTLGTRPEERVSAYTVVENVAGRTLSVTFGAGGTKAEAAVVLVPGSFTTLLLLPDGRFSEVADETQFNQARAKLTFYNATTDCADARLALEPGGQMVFERVAPGSEKMRSVNPVETKVRAACAAGAAPAFVLAGLEVGARYSAWLMHTPRPIAFLTRDSTRIWKP